MISPATGFLRGPSSSNVKQAQTTCHAQGPEPELEECRGNDALSQTFDVIPHTPLKTASTVCQPYALYEEGAECTACEKCRFSTGGIYR